MVPLRVEQRPHGNLGGIPGEGEHGDVGGGDGAEPFADGRHVPGAGLGGAGAGPPAEAVPVGGEASEGRLLQQLRVGPGTDLAVLLDVHVHGDHPHHLGDDEGQRSEVEGPAIGVALLGVALPWVPRVGRDVDYDPDDVAETCRGDKRDRCSSERQEWMGGCVPMGHQPLCQHTWAKSPCRPLLMSQDTHIFPYTQYSRIFPDIGREGGTTTILSRKGAFQELVVLCFAEQ